MSSSTWWMMKLQFRKDEVYWGLQAFAQWGESLLKTVESTLFNIVQHCSMLFNIVQHCSTLFNIVHHCSMLNRGTLATTATHPHIISAGRHKTHFAVESTVEHIWWTLYNVVATKHFCATNIIWRTAVCKGEACPGQRLYTFDEVNTNTRNHILCPPTIVGIRGCTMVDAIVRA